MIPRCFALKKKKEERIQLKYETMGKNLAGLFLEKNRYPPRVISILSKVNTRRRPFDIYDVVKKLPVKETREREQALISVKRRIQFTLAAFFCAHSI